MSPKRKFLESHFSYTESKNYKEIIKLEEEISINIAGMIVISALSMTIGVLIMVSLFCK